MSQRIAGDVIRRAGDALVKIPGQGFFNPGVIEV